MVGTAIIYKKDKTLNKISRKKLQRLLHISKIAPGTHFVYIDLDRKIMKNQDILFCFAACNIFIFALC